jgi:hypothetical protein
VRHAQKISLHFGDVEMLATRHRKRQAIASVVWMGWPPGGTLSEKTLGEFRRNSLKTEVSATRLFESHDIVRIVGDQSGDLPTAVSLVQ